VSCTPLVDGYICREQMRVTVRRPHGEPRWCFRCRKVRPFIFRVMSPVGMSYYGPVPSIRCGTCDLVDGDLFPGRQREWEE
jgi:hypothetical protein